MLARYFLVCLLLAATSVFGEDPRLNTLREVLLKNDLLWEAKERPRGDTDQLKHNLVFYFNSGFIDHNNENTFYMEEILDPGETIGIENDYFKHYFIDSQIKNIFNGDPVEELTICLKKGTPLESIPYYFESISSGDPQKFFVEKCQRVEFGLVNFYDESLDVFWENPYNQERVFQGELQIGEQHTFWRSSFIGHAFIVTKNINSAKKTSKKHVDESNLMQPGEELRFRVTCDEIKVLGKQDAQKGKRANVTQGELDYVNVYERKRSDRIKRKFTPTGYERIPRERFPKRLWGSIRTFWHNNKQNLFEEIWVGRSYYVNWWESTPTMAVVPFGLKATWHEMFQPLLETWTGTKLIPTDLYGIRVYYNNSWLVTHVDRHETHAVSAIIQVEQMDMRDDWKLEIYSYTKGLADELSSENKIIWSDLQEGEAMYYESAKVMHGRPKSMNGLYYANVFFHYQPVGPKEWWLEPTKADLSQRREDL